MQPRIYISVFLLLLALPTPGFAFLDVTAHIEPIQPLAGEDFTIIIEGQAETPPSVVEVVEESATLDIRLQRDACLEACVPSPFRLEVPIDGATAPLVEGINWLLVNATVGSTPDMYPIFSAYFAVGEVFAHSMEPRIILDPWQPTDNDRLRLLVPVHANGCGPWPPELERIERDGNHFSVFMRFDPGFGGSLGVLPIDAPWKCSPPYPYLDVSRTDLGVLEAGQYSLDLYFHASTSYSLPLRVGTRDFEVADAPDQANLRGDRFTVEVEWKDHDGEMGTGKPVPDPTSDSTLFTFFGKDNWELLIKVLDGCALNDRFWVFGSAATDVEYTVTVTDTEAGATWSYFNPLGTASKAINDTDAFATCTP